MDLNEILRLLGALMGVLGVVYWMWVAPERKRREKVGDALDAVRERLAELEKDMAIAQRDLKAGDKKFDEMVATLDDVRKTVHRLEKAFAAVAPALAREAE